MSLQAERRCVSPFDAAVGVNLSAIRERQGVTPQQLAGALGISRWQLLKYERGLCRISAGRLFCCSHALGAPIAEFYRGIVVSHV